MDFARKSIRGIIPLVVLALGFLLIILHLITHAGQMISSSFLPVVHPAAYQFKAFDRLLRATVRADRVDYQALKGSPLLNEAVEDLSKTSPDHLQTNEDALCFWINAYNLLVLKAISDAYPLRSIHEKMFPNNFSQPKFTVGGVIWSLQDIYQFELLPCLKKHPQAFFLICGGSLGYPALLNHEITPQSYESDSLIATRKFIENSQNVRFYPDRKLYIISPILKWNEGLFDKFGGPHNFVSRFMPADELPALTNILVLKTYAREFNWWLNDTATLSNEQGEASK